MKKTMTPRIKICGITLPEETRILNRAGIDYAGFVFYGPSKRNVTIRQAAELSRLLDPAIRRVAVMVSPTAEDVRLIEDAGFADVIQIHKELREETLREASLPVWAAVNISNISGIEATGEFLSSMPGHLSDKISAIVADAPDFGSGVRFDWEQGAEDIRTLPLFKGRQFILAGGLKPENVSEGIRLFAPDIVDVSSGVEGNAGKDEDKINAFVKAVRTL